MLLDPPMLAAVALLALGAAVVGGIGGFGTGVILTAALAPLIGVKALVPVLAVAGVIINAGRFWFYRASLNRPALGVVLAASLPFLVFGTWLYSVLDARAIGTILGIAVIASVPLRRTLKKRAVTLGTRGLAVGSGVFGLASGVATGTGVILVSLLLGAGLAGPAVLATDALVTIALDLSKALLFQRFALHDEQAFFTGVVIGVATIPGERARRLAGDTPGREAARALHGSLDPRRRELHAVAFMAMNELGGKVAAVTGAASGLGRAMALAFAAEGMRLALADVDEAGLAETRRKAGVKALTSRVDVSNSVDVEAFAKRCMDEFGAVHIVCNNAGVAVSGAVWENSEDEWRWLLGINLWGVIHGVRAFAPRLMAQDEGHIVNTASVAGLISPPGMGAYAASKHAVVALSECLRHDLAERGSRVGVSVLCPAYVPTGIAESRPPIPAPKSDERLAKEAALRKAVASGKLSADDVARKVLAAVKENRFYVLTHPAIKGAVRARVEDVLEERAPRDPLKFK